MRRVIKTVNILLIAMIRKGKTGKHDCQQDELR
jgi:hypothetical protein